MSIVIKTTNLGREYKTYQKKEGVVNSIKGFWNREYISRQALKNVNLEIEGGQIVGLVGANGAGKTTLLKILSGLIYPTHGSAEVLGFNPWERNTDFLKQMSLLLGQKNQLWWDISARDSYSLLTKIYDLDEVKARIRVDELADRMNCRHVLDIQLRRLSLGERMKMEIIGSLLHSPKVLFLDEPTIGLDIVSQAAIRLFLEEYVVQYKPVIILTSHYMDDIAQLSDRLLLISKGELVYDGTVELFSNTTETSKKMIYRYKNEIEQREIIFQTAELSEKLNEVVKLGEVVELKIEEVDFEEVIHRFLAKESRF